MKLHIIINMPFLLLFIRESPKRYDPLSFNFDLLLTITLFRQSYNMLKTSIIFDLFWPQLKTHIFVIDVIDLISCKYLPVDLSCLCWFLVSMGIDYGCVHWWSFPRISTFSRFMFPPQRIAWFSPLWACGCVVEVAGKFSCYADNTDTPQILGLVPTGWIFLVKWKDFLTWFISFADIKCN